MPLQRIEEAVNEVSDRDWSWWPFIWLRPEKHVALSLSRVVVLSLLYGVPSSLLMAVGVGAFRALTVPELVQTAASFPVVFLFMGSLVIAPMWNRRADRLRARVRREEDAAAR